MNILALIVVYNQKINETKTLKSLLKNYENNPQIFENFKLLIYDNGPIDQECNFELPYKFDYFSNPKNDGLASAYNFALSVGIKENYTWLLLLDQDSYLPDDYIINLTNDVISAESNSMVMAVVPKMCYKNHFFSPSKVLFGGIHRPIDMKFIGVYPNEVFAIGSCSLVKISFLHKEGGFNEFFWLDCLDRWLYMIIYKRGGKVLVTNSVIEHELSIMDYSKFVSSERYYNIMIYETFFMNMYKSKPENFVYYLRLVKRIISFSFSRKTYKYSILTLKHLNSLLFTSTK